MSRTSTTTISKTKQSTKDVQPIVGPLRADGRGWPVQVNATKGLKQFSWEEVSSHNTPKSAWVYYGNKVYDITSWFGSHPGGCQALSLAAGRDITDILPSYHPFSDKPLQVLQKFEIGELLSTEFPQYRPDSGFYKAVRKECGEYFKRTGYNSKDPLPGLLRLTFMLLTAAICYSILNFGWNRYNLYVQCIAAVVFGCMQALPLLHCMHDASHTSIGNNETWWIIIGRFTMDWFAGASINSWHNQHVLGHHLYTNVMGVDPDLPQSTRGDIRRITDKQEWAPKYKYQHLYLLILYGLLGLKFRVQDITDTMIDQTNGQIRVNPLGLKEIVSQILTKSVWAAWRILFPLYILKVPSLQFWILFLISEFVTGYYLAFNFQVSHVSPPAEFPDLQRTTQFDAEWAVSQLETTVDYSHNNWISAFACGALNYQSVHHLFPSVSQYHYPALAPIIMKIAKQYGVRYNYVGSFWDAFLLHIKHLKNMGIQLNQFHMH